MLTTYYVAMHLDQSCRPLTWLEPAEDEDGAVYDDPHQYRSWEEPRQSSKTERIPLIPAFLVSLLVGSIITYWVVRLSDPILILAAPEPYTEVLLTGP